jgi:hypothetical protein
MVAKVCYFIIMICSIVMIVSFVAKYHNRFKHDNKPVAEQVFVEPTPTPIPDPVWVVKFTAHGGRYGEVKINESTIRRIFEIQKEVNGSVLKIEPPGGEDVSVTNFSFDGFYKKGDEE